MNKLTRTYFTLIILLIFYGQLFSQGVKISDNLTLYKLSDNCYIHTQKNNNGIVFINANKAIIVSTPDSDIETQNLINWVRNEKKVKIVAYVIDRWHPDAMQGLDIVNENGIKTYANKRTKRIAKTKGLPLPKVSFNNKKSIKVANEKIICHYLGEAHTEDGIVVWIPSEKILFGGNEIRNYRGWVGNIGDANLEKWSETATKIKEHYGAAKIVVPGHGKYGGSELIDYTINLYKIPKNDSLKRKKDNKIELNQYDDKKIVLESELDSINNGKRILTNAKIIVQDQTKLIEIESSEIWLQENKTRIDSKSGRVKIYDKLDNKIKLRTDVNFNKLIVLKYDETVGFVVIVKEITSANN